MDRTEGVADTRREEILARLAATMAPGSATKRLCEVCAEVTEVSGAGVMLMAGEVPRGSVCTTDEVSALIEELQYVLGEGPCVDAFTLGRPVAEANLAEPEVPRWPAFSGPAVAGGAMAVFGFPLRVGAVRLGAMNLYADRPGALSDDQFADALVMADIAASAVLALQAEASPGELSAELERGGDFQYVVHQAAGMVAVQLGVSVGQALLRLRAYAFGHDRAIADVASDVVARHLRFGAPSEGDDGGES